MYTDNELCVEISNNILYVNGSLVEHDNFDKTIIDNTYDHQKSDNKKIFTLSVLPRIIDKDKKKYDIGMVKNNLDLFNNIIFRTLILCNQNVESIIIPFLNNDIIGLLFLFKIKELIIFDFSLSKFDNEQFSILLLRSNITDVGYMCGIPLSDNDRIVNQLALQFPTIHWFPYCFYFQEVQEAIAVKKLSDQHNSEPIQKKYLIKQINLLAYSIEYKGKKYNIEIILGNLVNIKNSVIFLPQNLPEKSRGIISKWFIDGLNVYDICWNTFDYTKSLVCYYVSKKSKILCNEVMQYINEEHEQSKLTSIDNVYSIEEWIEKFES